VSIDHKEVVAEFFEQGIKYGQEHDMSRTDLRDILESLMTADLPEIPCMVGSYDDAVRVALMDIESMSQLTATGPIERKNMNFAVHQGDEALTTMTCDWPGEETHHCAKYMITQVGDAFEVTAINHVHKPGWSASVIVRS
jgi:hypothetical protein